MTAAGMLLTAGVATIGWGEEKLGVGFPRPDAEKTLRSDFQTPPRGYNDVPFWWWSGEKLDKQRLLEQIETLHAAGVSGMQVNYSHTRIQMKSFESEPPIFSDEWWDIFNFVAEECAKRGMGVGLSGYTLDWAGQENLFKKLGINAPDTCARHLTSACKRLPNGKFETVAQNGTLDPLNPESAKRTIERFLNPFLQRLSPLGRSALNYFFQDELFLGGGCYYVGPLRLWSDDFAAEFKKRKGYDIVPFLKGLWGDVGPMTYKVRLDYNDVMVALTEERYFKPIYDWHASRGMIYGCDPSHRGRAPMEFGDYMRTVRWYTAPGFDTPGRSADLIKNKVGSSIAHLNRRPRVWLEGYHSLGWQATPETIFDSSVHNFVYGSTLLNLHGLYYSTYGGWWEWAPPCYHHHMPYWRHMPVYLKYFERLSYALSQGVHVADVAVVNPLEALLADSNEGRGAVGLAHGIVSELVAKRGVDCDFIDSESLAKAEVKDGRLHIAGEAYRALVVPHMRAMRLESLRKLVALRQAGGVVAVFGGAPSVTDASENEMAEAKALCAELAKAPYHDSPRYFDYDRLVGALGTRDFVGPKGVKVLHRRIGEHNLYYLVDLKQNAYCTFRTTGVPELWNPWSGEQKACESWRQNADGTTTVALKPTGQPLLVAFAPGAKTAGTIPFEKAFPVDAPEAKLALDGEWNFTVLPELDDKWGDFRLPAEKDKLGAEIRRFKSDVPGREGYETCGFGPQFRAADGSLHSFSWRYGEETHPGFQNWHHGLCKFIGDDFFTLGHYDMGLYDVRPGRDVNQYAYETFICVPEACTAKLVVHGVAPTKILVDGKEVKAEEELKMAAGYRPLRVEYATKGGRAALVAMRTDVASKSSTLPLSMRWYDDPAVLKFDPFGGKVTTTKFTATVPPGFRAARMGLNGELVGATIGGRVAKVSREGQLWVAAGEGQAGEELVLMVKSAMGAVGCGVFREMVKLECATGKTTLGDWARYDGLACYSGGAEYVRSFTLTAEQAASRLTLDLGRVSATCAISVNGDQPTVLCAPPWRVDLAGRVKAGENRLSVQVYNTLNNHCQTIPTRYKCSTQNAPSGLLGPVTIEVWARGTRAPTGGDVKSSQLSQSSQLPSDRITWTTPSRDSWDSMPLSGRHGAGANVWVQDGDIWVYPAHCAAFDEKGNLLKLGCLRLTPKGVKLGEGDFRQELDPGLGTITITQGEFAAKLWFADETLVFESENASAQPLEVKYGTWRDETRTVVDDCWRSRHEYGKDHVEATKNGILAWHDNAERPFDVAKRAKAQSTNPASLVDATARRVSGLALVAAGGFTADPAAAKVRWQRWSGKAWSAAVAPRAKHVVTARLGSANGAKPQEWAAQARKLLEDAAREQADRDERAGWDEFWQRSFIRINSDRGSDDEGYICGRNYRLFRYMRAANRDGEFPMLFNGGIFNPDWFNDRVKGNNNPDLQTNISDPTTPEFRRWLGCRFMSQNQRLVAWPSIADGDTDLYAPGQRFYRNGAKAAADRARANGADGVMYPESLDIWGLGGLASHADGRCSLKHLEYHFSMGLENAWMCLQAHDVLGVSLKDDLQWVLGTVYFYDSFYRSQTKKRTGQELGADGKLVMFPGNTLEYARGATNPIDGLSGLWALVERLLALAEVSSVDRERLMRIRAELPELPTGTREGVQSLLPAKSFEFGYNGNEPCEMYAAWPYRRVGVTRPETMELLRNSWDTIPSERVKDCVEVDLSWQPTIIGMAQMGRSEEARLRLVKKLGNLEAPQARFPAFFGPGHDTIPDIDGGGSNVLGLQEMLMACEPGPKGKIHLLPAWPKDWDVTFKLRAPGQTEVYVEFRAGKIAKLGVTPESRRDDIVVEVK